MSFMKAKLNEINSDFAIRKSAIASICHSPGENGTGRWILKTINGDTHSLSNESGRVLFNTINERTN